jgi:predicted phosphodiesterase
MPLQGEIIKSYLGKFPDATSHTLSRIIYKENNKLFTNEEAVRALIRNYRGANGSNKDTSFLRDKRTGKDTFPKLPEGLTSLDNWNIFKIVGDHNVLVLSDIHIPYHVKDVIEIAVKTGKKHKVDIILLNGDIFDFFSISHWVKNPTKRDFKEEVDTGKQFLAWLRYKFPNARIIFKNGNHEEWYERYMAIKAPELFSINNFELSNFFDFDKYRIEWVKDKRPIKLNEVFVIHGHEYKAPMVNPVNPARGLYLRAKKNAIEGHYHQSSSHSEKDIEDNVTTCWSLGCLSDLHPDYMPLNKHNHGFGIVKTYKDKMFNVSSYKIINNELFSE